LKILGAISLSCPWWQKSPSVLIKGQGWPCVLKDFSQIGDFWSKYLDSEKNIVQIFYPKTQQKQVLKWNEETEQVNILV
jgi:hypothetical protein